MYSWIVGHVSEFDLPKVVFALLGPAFGVFVGAWLTRRTQNKKIVVSELNSINAALFLCLSICNKAMALKKQHVRPMVERYTKVQADYTKFELAKTYTKTPVPKVFTLYADLQTLTLPKMPTELLERYVFDKISVSGRAIAAAVDLVGAVDSLKAVLQLRNDMILETREKAPTPEQLVHVYLGTANEVGIRDERFKNSIEAIACYTDDCIFFAQTLTNDLYKYGTKLRRWNRLLLRTGLPRVSQADWSTPVAEGLLPAKTQYSQWLRGFKEQGRWYRVFLPARPEG